MFTERFHLITPSLSKLILPLVIIGTRTSMIAADAGVLVVTWLGTHEIRQIAAQAHYRAGFTKFLLRDGKFLCSLIVS